MRTILLITVALLTLLVSGCTAQPNSDAPATLVLTAAAQAPTNTPAPSLVQESEGSTPIAPLAVQATPAPEPVSELLSDETTAATGVEALIDVANIRLRAGPGLSYDQLQFVRANERYQVLGKSSSGVWFQLDAAGGAGWIPARYMVLVGDVDLVPVVADDLGLVLPLGKTPMPKVTNTPIAAAPPPAPPPPTVRPAPSGNASPPAPPSSPPAPPSSPPTEAPTPIEQPTSPPSVPTDGFTPIAPTTVPNNLTN